MIPSFFININSNSYKYKKMLSSDVRGLYEAYNKVYAPKFETILDELSDEHVEELTDDLIEEVVEEVFYECLEEGYDIDEVENVLIESLQTSLNLLNEVSDSYYADAVKSGKEKAAKAKRAETIEKVKGAIGKVGSEIKRRAANAAVSAYAAGKMAKGAAGEAATAAGEAAKKVGAAAGETARKAGEAAGEVAKKAGGAAKEAGKAAGKAALTGAGYAAGKAVKYAKKAGEAVSAGYKAGSKDDGESAEDTGSETSPRAFPARSRGSSQSSDEGSGETTQRGSLRRAAGNLLKRGIKKVLRGGAKLVSKTAKGVEAAARGVSGLADKAQERLREEMEEIEESKKRGTASGRKKLAAKIRRGEDVGKPGGGFEKIVQKASPKYGKKRATKIAAAAMWSNLANSYEVEGELVDEAGPLLPGEPGKAPSSGYKEPILPGEKRKMPYQQAPSGQGRLPQAKTPAAKSLQVAHYEYDEEDIYNIVMEYLLDNGHADTISEANYIMTEMDVDMIATIVEQSQQDLDKLSDSINQTTKPKPAKDPSGGRLRTDPSPRSGGAGGGMIDSLGNPRF